MHTGPQCGCWTHLGLRGATFISDQQQIALSVDDNLFLEPATCHTHTHTQNTWLHRKDRAWGGQTDVGFACGKIRPRLRPWRQP